MRTLGRFMFWLLAIPVGALVVVFALSNRQTVSIGFWPFEDGVQIPVYAAVLAPLLAGLVIGLSTGASRRLAALARARRLGRQVTLLERRVASAVSPVSSEDHP